MNMHRTVRVVSLAALLFPLIACASVTSGEQPQALPAAGSESTACQPFDGIAAAAQYSAAPPQSLDSSKEYFATFNMAKGGQFVVQLYPDKDHGVLIGAIKAQGAEVDTVLPYAYDAQAADANIIAAIGEMAEGRVDAIALTNLGQIRRLIEVARTRGCEDRLRAGLDRTPIASVGPAVSDELKSHGLRTDIYPAEDAFFMRPLISAMATALSKNPPRMAAAGS